MSLGQLEYIERPNPEQDRFKKTEKNEKGETEREQEGAHDEIDSSKVLCNDFCPHLGHFPAAPPGGNPALTMRPWKGHSRLEV